MNGAGFAMSLSASGTQQPMPQTRAGAYRVRSGFTLLELLIVIIIIAVLASVAIPILQGKIDAAKWSEANSAAGAIRTAVSAYTVRNGLAAAQANLVGKSLDDVATQNALGFLDSDLTGTYFVPADYQITAINALGKPAVQVTSSQPNAPEGSKTLNADGSWE